MNKKRIGKERNQEEIKLKKKKCRIKKENIKM